MRLRGHRSAAIGDDVGWLEASRTDDRLDQAQYRWLVLARHLFRAHVLRRDPLPWRLVPVRLVLDIASFSLVPSHLGHPLARTVVVLLIADASATVAILRPATHSGLSAAVVDAADESASGHEIAAVDALASVDPRVPHLRDPPMRCSRRPPADYARVLHTPPIDPVRNCDVLSGRTAERADELNARCGRLDLADLGSIALTLQPLGCQIALPLGGH